ncbi:hypothetical protein LguiA_018088 [Lonicera macranthoides]
MPISLAFLLETPKSSPQHLFLNKFFFSSIEASRALPSSSALQSSSDLSKDAMAHLRASQPVESGDEGIWFYGRLKAVGGSRATNSRGTYQDHEKDKVIATLKEQVASQAEQLASQAQQLAAQNNRLNETTDVLAQLQKFIPGFQYQPQTGPPNATSNNPSND